MRRLAIVTDEFREKVGRLVHQLVYRTPSFKGGKKYLSVFAVRDPQDAEDPGYMYVERLGRDSVALVFYDEGRGDKPWLLMEQFHSPLKKFVLGACTGSLDKPELDAKQIAKEEAAEEVGYDVELDRITEVGYEPVSANTNEQVHLFLVNVTGLKFERPKPENIFEANVNLYWASTSQVLERGEWKAKLIVLKALKRA